MFINLINNFDYKEIQLLLKRKYIIKSNINNNNLNNNNNNKSIFSNKNNSLRLNINNL